MEGQMSKRRRIYSLEQDNKILGATFAQKYVQHLVPALRHINKKKKSSSGDHKEFYELRKNVKYEMDMALALSTGRLGFAWSQALGNNLRRDYDTNTVGSFELDDNRLAVSTNRARFPTLVSLKSKCMHENEEFKGSSKRSKVEKAVEESSEEEHEQIGEGQLSSLRKLLPGGKEILDEEEVLVEVASYIICLQQQVHILQCLAQTHDS